MGQGLNCSSGILQDRRDSGCSTLNQRLRSRFWLPGYGSAKIFESKPKTAKNNFLLKPKSEKRDD